jgi:hypothetical protein
MFMDLSTTQAVGSGLSDLIFFQRPEIFYGIAGAMILVGVTFWILGHQIHQMFLAAVLLALGLLVGYHLGSYYGFEGTNALLAALAGGLLGAGLGYWLFKFWLGILASALIALILFGMYSWKIALPYLAIAARESQVELQHRGLELAPGQQNPLAGKLPIPVKPGPESQARKSPIGQAYRDLEILLPKFSGAKYPNSTAWRQNLPSVAQGVWEKMILVIPRLSVDVFLISGVALIFGLVLVVLRPIFLDIAYTSLLGLILTAGGAGLFYAWKSANATTWVKENFVMALIGFGILWLVGLGVQFKMIPPPPPPAEEEAEGEEPPEKEKSKGGKKKS